MLESILERLAISPGQALILAALGFFIGVDKMGLRGGPIIFIPFLATAFGARFTSGLLAPLLCIADILAVLVYHRSWDRKLAFRVLLWMITGILLAVLVGGSLSESLYRSILGVILLALLGTMSFLEFRRDKLKIPSSPLVTGSIGVIAGFSSMIGNIAGPILSLFLLAKRLDKKLFLGTSAAIFLVVNAVKLPLHVFAWGTVNSRSLGMDAIALPFLFLGALAGKPLVAVIPEKGFRYFIMAIVLVGAIRLFIS